LKGRTTAVIIFMLGIFQRTDPESRIPMTGRCAYPLASLGMALLP